MLTYALIFICCCFLGLLLFCALALHCALCRAIGISINQFAEVNRLTNQ